MTRLEQQLNFILEIDKLKQILRRTRLLHGGEELGRFENTAEHCWHITLMAVVFAEHSNEPVDVGRVVRMLLVHDLVEIDAGDTPAFGEQGSKEALEAAGAERIFGLLPEDQRAEFIELWREFEGRETAESRYANAVDRFLPTFQNIQNQGGSWGDFAVTRARADARLSPIGEGSQALWGLVQGVLDEGEARGYFKDPDASRGGL
ncbi:MAG: HD domain-containing protein [Acidobacteria bacterium]|nr:HD domain-containing protein [Acidobacteriota bacterium]